MSVHASYLSPPDVANQTPTHPHPLISADMASPKKLSAMTKAEHRQLLFKMLKNCVELAVQYTVVWDGQHEPSDGGFIEWLEDIVKMLPTREGDFPQCTFMMYNKMRKRSKDYPIRIIENIDPSRPIHKPTILRCSDGTSSIVEQVPCKKLRTPTARKPYSVKSNTPGFLPVPQPFRVTFTPATPIDPTEDSFRRGVSYEVKEDGKVRSFDAPPILVPDLVPATNPKAKGPQDRSVEQLGRTSMARRVGGMPMTAVEPMQKGIPPVRVLTSLSPIPRRHDSLDFGLLDATPKAPSSVTNQPAPRTATTPTSSSTTSRLASSSKIPPASSIPISSNITAPIPSQELSNLDVTTHASPSRSSTRDPSIQTPSAVSTIPFTAMSSSQKPPATFLDPNDCFPVLSIHSGSQPQAGSSISPSPPRPIRPLPSGKKGSLLGKLGPSSLSGKLSLRGSSTSKGKKRARESENEFDGPEGRPAQRPKNDEAEGPPLWRMTPERFLGWRDAVLQVLGQQPGHSSGAQEKP